MVGCSPVNLEGLAEPVFCNLSVFIENLQQSFLENRKIMCIPVKKGLDFKNLCVIVSAYSHFKSVWWSF